MKCLQGCQKLSKPLDCSFTIWAVSMKFYMAFWTNKMMISWKFEGHRCNIEKIPIVPTTPVWTKPVLCTNWPKFTMLFYYLKVPPHFSPPGPTLALTGALKWGTVWTSTSNGTGIMKGQSWSCILINFDLS